MVAFLNDLEQAAPTIGSTLGGIGGALLGVPAAVATGGVANPIDLGMAGAGAGGALGQVVENKTQGKGHQQNPLKTGAESAALDLAGAGVGKGLQAGGKLAIKAIPHSLVAQSKNFLTHDVAQYLADNGITDFKQAAQLGKQITGAPGESGATLTNAVYNAMDNSGAKIDLNPEFQNWTTPLQGYTDVQGTNAETNISNTVNNIMKQAVGGDNMASVPTKNGAPIDVPLPGMLKNISAGAAFRASKALQSVANVADQGARDATGAVINSPKAAAAAVYRNLAKAIEDKTVGSSTVPITDADKTAMKNELASMAKKNPRLYGDLANKIDSAQSWSDIRSIQEPFVKVSQADQAASHAANKAPGIPLASSLGLGGVGLATAGRVGGIVGGVLPTIARALERSPAAEKGLAKGVSFANKAANVLARISPATSTAVGTAAANPQPSPQQSNATQGGAMTPTAATVPAAGGVTPDPAGIFSSLINPGGGTSANYAPIALQALMGMFDPNLMSQYSGAANTAEGTINKAQQAEAALNALQGTYGQAQGGAGPGGTGILDRLHQMITGQSASPLAGGYNSQSQQLDTLLKGLGAPTQAPSLFLGQGAANNQFSAIQQFLASLGAGPGQPSAIPTQ